MKSPLMAALVAATLVFAHNAGAQDDDRNNDRYWGIGLSSSANVDQSTDLFGSDDHRDNFDSNSAKKIFFGYIIRDDAGKSGIGFEAGYVDHIETNYAAFGSGASVDIDMTSLYLAAVGTITLSKYGDDDEKKLNCSAKLVCIPGIGMELVAAL